MFLAFPEIGHLGTFGRAGWSQLPHWEVGNRTGRYTTMCAHTPACPDANDQRCWTAHVVSDHSEQGWCRLCNGVVLFDDGFYMAPDGHAEPVLLSA
jgi:hypothetical protein